MFLALLLLLSVIIIVPRASVAEQDGDFVYQLEGSPAIAVITGYTGAGGAIIIPATLGGYATGAIGASAFIGIASLTSVSIPNSVTSIGDWAFYECTSLTSVTMGNGVTSIGHYAFAICTSLATITIPDSVTSIGDGAFSECTFTSVTIGNGVISIGDRAFSWCASLISVTIPNSVTIIGDGAFASCTYLASVTIGSSVTSIGSWAFNTCPSLTSISFLGLVAPTQIGEYWIMDTNPGIRGHAYAASNFPAPGLEFHGLIMGEVITTAGTPGPPRDLNAAAGNAQVTLIWTAPASDGGNPITGYKVYRGYSPGTYADVITLGNVTTYIDSGLMNGQIYYYKVSATNSAGEGSLSEEVTVMPKASGDGNNMMLVILVVVVIAAIGAGVALFYKRRK